MSSKPPEHFILLCPVLERNMIDLIVVEKMLLHLNMFCLDINSLWHYLCCANLSQ